MKRNCGSVDEHDIPVSCILCHTVCSISNAFVPATRMGELLKEALGTVTLKKTGKGGGGHINKGEAYLTDTQTVFVKYKNKPQVKSRFLKYFVSA